MDGTAESSNLPGKLMHVNKESKLFNKDSLNQFIKFGIVGVSNTVVAYVIYIVALFFIDTFLPSCDVDFVVANVISWLLSVLWSFYWNWRTVFKASEKGVSWKMALLKTYASYAFTGLVLNNVLSILWINFLGISKAIAPLINAAIGFPVNFLLNKLWAFNKK